MRSEICLIMHHTFSNAYIDQYTDASGNAVMIHSTYYDTHAMRWEMQFFITICRGESLFLLVANLVNNFSIFLNFLHHKFKKRKKSRQAKKKIVTYKTCDQKKIQLNKSNWVKNSKNLQQAKRKTFTSSNGKWQKRIFQHICFKCE